MIDRLEAHFCNWDAADRRTAKNALFKYKGESTFRESIVGISKSRYAYKSEIYVKTKSSQVVYVHMVHDVSVDHWA